MTNPGRTLHDSDTAGHAEALTWLANRVKWERVLTELRQLSSVAAVPNADDDEAQAAA